MLVAAQIPPRDACPECLALRAVNSVSLCLLHKAAQALYEAGKMHGKEFVIATPEGGA